MSVEDQIIEKVSKLDEDRQKQVLPFIETLEKPRLTLGEWLEMAEASLDEMRAKHGDDFVVGSQALLDEVREERLDDLMRDLIL